MGQYCSIFCKDYCCVRYEKETIPSKLKQTASPSYGVQKYVAFRPVIHINNLLLWSHRPEDAHAYCFFLAS